MRALLALSLVTLLWFAAARVLPASEPTAEQLDFFEKQVRPVLFERCSDCHSGESPESGLRVDSRAALLKGGTRGPAIVPGDPQRSLLLIAVNHSGQLFMPPKEKIPRAEIAVLSEWVRRGAPWPGDELTEGETVGEPRSDSPLLSEEDRNFWAFRPPRAARPPDVTGCEWVRNPIDAFILARLEAAGLSPAPGAGKVRLIRRATFDLTGLPPTPEEVDAFLADSSEDALARVVERLLASPHYGVRWGRRWLDVARYADSNGLDENLAYANAYRYRDYVVDAFNHDKPYDQFIQEQLAGDLLPLEDFDERMQAITATGFLSIGPKMLAEDDPVKMQMDIVDEQIDTVGRAFMGLTLGCARCHDHKFDPVPTEDYYALAGIFRSTHTMDTFTVVARWHERPLAPEAEVAKEREQQQAINGLKEEIDKLKKAIDKLKPKNGCDQLNGNSDAPATTSETTENESPEELEQKLATLQDKLKQLEDAKITLPVAMAVSEGEPVDVPLHIRGSHFTLGSVVPRGFPQVISSVPTPAIPRDRSGRWELAWWLTRPEHPLTSRVMVNRIWLGHFCEGLVRTPDNFGRLGERPTHPELLDWLAVEFVRSGWSIKHMHRLMMLSATYQMSTSFDADAQARDPENRLYWRQNRRRLEAEAIRDAILFVSDSLDLTMGGSLLPTPNRQYVTSTANVNPVVYDSNRRSHYLPVVRSAVYDVFQAFDFPDPAVLSGQRISTTVAPQAMFMMNSQLVADNARRLAVRVTSIAGTDDAARVRELYRLTLSRAPAEDETDEALEYLDQLTSALEDRGSDRPAARLVAWQSLCRVLIASNEFLFTE